MHVLPLGFDHQREYDGGNVYHDGDYHDDDNIHDVNTLSVERRKALWSR